MSTTKTIKVPATLYRQGETRTEGEGEQKRTWISISSDVPYLRYDYWNDEQYYEVLDHSPGSVKEERLKAGLPMLYNHKRDTHLGRARQYRNDGHRISVSDVIWSESDDAQMKKKDHDNGVLVDTSVGYSLLDEGRCIGEQDGIPVYAFRFEPHEFSLVTIPADVTVGAGREQKPYSEPCEIVVNLHKDLDTKPNIRQKTDQNRRNMSEPAATTTETTPQIDVVREREDAAKTAREAYKANAKKIREYVTKGIEACPAWRDDLEKVAQKHLDGDANFDAFQAEAPLTFPGARKLTESDPEAKLGLGKSDIKRFSLARAILAAATKNWKGAEHEREVVEATATRYHGKDNRQWGGLALPEDITASSFAEVNDLSRSQLRDMAEVAQRMAALQGRTLNVSTFSQGGALVGTELLGGSLIDILRNAVLIGQGPLSITELTGIIGNIAIPKQTGTSTVYWLAENASISESTQALAQLLLSPKRMGAITSYTKQLLAQASVSVEMFVRSDIALTMAVEEDRVAFYGSGVNGEPLGIFNTTGTLANVTFSGNATWADMVALEYGLENANVRNGQQTIVTSPLTKSYLKQTTKVANSTFPIYLWERNEAGQFPTIAGVMPGIVNEYPAYATKQISTDVMVQGVFQNLIKARWAGFDVVVDPYTGAATESIRLVVNQWLDLGLRYPQSFNISTDAPTAPS